MKTYSNIKQLCAAFDADTFWKFGRIIYHRTECGPWVSLVLTEGRTCFYSVEDANDPTLLDDPDIIGIQVGSVVEGSGVDVGPSFLRFPFTDSDFDEVVRTTNAEACFYWDRDNIESYEVVSSSGKTYYVDVSPFDRPQAAGKRGSVPSATLSTFRSWYATYDGTLEDGESVTFSVNPPSTKRVMTITRIDKSEYTY